MEQRRTAIYLAFLRLACADPYDGFRFCLLEALLVAHPQGLVAPLLAEGPVVGEPEVRIAPQDPAQPGFEHRH